MGALEGVAQQKRENTLSILAKAAALQQQRKSGATADSLPPVPGIALGKLANRPQAGPSRPTDTDFSAAPSAVRKRAEKEVVAKPSGPVGPAKPPSDSQAKAKKHKKEKKDKKNDGTADKQKKKKKKDKGKLEISSSESSNEAQQMKRAKRYKGHFSHPSFGEKALDISVELNKKTPTGVWAIMGAILDSTVNITQEDNNLVFSDGKVMLDGMMDKRGIVRGEVVMQGDGGGNFVLSPDGPSALTPEQTKEMVVK